jgi:hypothetical protein
VSHPYKTAGRVIILYGLWIADEKKADTFRLRSALSKEPN